MLRTAFSSISTSQNGKMRDESHLFHSCNCCWWKRLILLPHLNMDSRKKSAPSASWVKTLNHPGFFCEDPLSMGFLLARYLVGFRAESGTGEEWKVTSPQCIFSGSCSFPRVGDRRWTFITSEIEPLKINCLGWQGSEVGANKAFETCI